MIVTSDVEGKLISYYCYFRGISQMKLLQTNNYYQTIIKITINCKVFYYLSLFKNVKQNYFRATKILVKKIVIRAVITFEPSPHQRQFLPFLLPLIVLNLLQLSFLETFSVGRICNLYFIVCDNFLLFIHEEICSLLILLLFCKEENLCKSIRSPSPILSKFIKIKIVRASI